MSIGAVPSTTALKAADTHRIALEPGNRLIRHSQDLGWQDVYVSVAVHEPYRAVLPAMKHNCVAFCLRRGARIVRSIEDRDAVVDRALAPRQFGIIPAGALSRWDVRGSPETMLIYLRDSLMQKAASEVFDTDIEKMLIAPRLGEVDPLLEQIAMSLLEVLQSDEANNNLYVGSLAYAMSVQLLRRHTLTTRAVRGAAREACTPRMRGMRRLEEFIDNALDEDLGLDRLAAEVGLSTYYFVGAFSKVFGVSPHQYVLRKRIERAQSLLRTTDLPIAELALACGFSSQSHLTAAFKRVVGVPPRAYRTTKSA